MIFVSRFVVVGLALSLQGTSYKPRGCLSCQSRRGARLLHSSIGCIDYKVSGLSTVAPPDACSPSPARPYGKATRTIGSSLPPSFSLASFLQRNLHQQSHRPTEEKSTNQTTNPLHQQPPKMKISAVITAIVVGIFAETAFAGVRLLPPPIPCRTYHDCKCASLVLPVW